MTPAPILLTLPSVQLGYPATGPERLNLESVAADAGLPFSTTRGAAMNATVQEALSRVRNSPSSNSKRNAIQLPAGAMKFLGRLGRVDCPLVGAVPGDASATQLWFSALDDTQLGGDCAIYCENQDTRKDMLRDLTVKGPALPPSGLVSPPESYHTGVRGYSGFTWRNVVSLNWCYGFDVRGDHFTLRDCSGSNWCGLYWGPLGPISSDHLIDNCDFAGQRFASMVCAPSGFIPTGTMVSTHLGGSQYGVWKMAASRRVADYSTGTINVNATSRVVTGSGTAWKAAVKNGARLTWADNPRGFHIESIDTDTQITLSAPPGVDYSGSYVAKDGESSRAFIVYGEKFLDTTWESCAAGLIVSEDPSYGTVSNNLFLGSDSGNNAYSTLFEPAAAISCRDVLNNQFARSAGLLGLDNWTQARMKAASIMNNDFGILGVPTGGDLLIPFAKGQAAVNAGQMVVSGNRASINGQEASVEATRGFVVPGDLLMDVTVAADAAPYVGRYAGTRRLARGVAVTAADGLTEQGVVVGR